MVETRYGLRTKAEDGRTVFVDVRKEECGCMDKNRIRVLVLPLGQQGIRLDAGADGTHFEQVNHARIDFSPTKWTYFDLYMDRHPVASCADPSGSPIGTLVSQRDLSGIKIGYTKLLEQIAGGLRKSLKGPIKIQAEFPAHYSGR